MKVLQINSVCGIRSTGRICTDLAEVLEQNGHECKIAYGREFAPEEFQNFAVKIGSDFDVNLHALQSRFFDNSGFGSKKTTERFITWVKEYDPDIIHLHNIHGYYINIEVLFNCLAKINKPVVWTLHDCWAFTGHCAYYSFAQCEKWKTGCGHCPQKKKYPTSDFVDASRKNWLKKKALFTSVDKMAIVTPSKWLATQVEQSFLSKYPIKVIPNGIDLDVFKPTSSNFRKKNKLEGKKIVLGVATAWGPRKGLNDFIELSKALDDSYKVVLVGLTKKQKNELPSDILKITRTNNVRELAEIYTAADVFFNPGREETMGLTTVEAMACGTPVVVSNCTAVPEVVSECSGKILESLDMRNVKKEICAVIEKKWDCCEDAKKYNKKLCFHQYLDLYSSMIKENEND